MTFLPSTGRCGKVRGLWPVAMMMLSAVTVWALPSGLVRVSVLGPANEAVPVSTVILFFFIRKSMPFDMPLATSRERFITAGKSAFTSPTTRPKSLAWRMLSSISALFSRALVGMQPQLRQMPPRCSRSTTAVFLPCCAALIAAT